MVKITQALIGVAGALFASSALAHPGGEPELTKGQLRTRAAELDFSSRALSACSLKHRSNGFHKRNIERRSKKAAALRKARGIPEQPWIKRGLEELKKDHSRPGVTPNTPIEEIFSNEDAACVLASDAMVGPYYIDGELIREDVTEDEEGVILDVDLQVIDVNTCEPVPDMYVDFWQANSTGVYSGVVAGGNGDIGDTTNWNNTFGRGIYPSDDEGIVHFKTLFPGHYTGRAIHIHILTHEGGEVLPNNTFQGGHGSHVGQIYFDQDLITQVEEQPPYNTNEQKLTPNDQDFILQQQLKDSTWSPIMEYSLVGNTVEEGIFAWITLAINREAEFEVNPVAHWTENGGVPAQGGGGPPAPPQ